MPSPFSAVQISNNMVRRKQQNMQYEEFLERLYANSLVRCAK
jgi:hypothetical protein